MKPKSSGNENLPDFKELSDRVLADRPSEPILVIKTNLDPSDSTEENPYLQEKPKDTESFRAFFEE